MNKKDLQKALKEIKQAIEQTNQKADINDLEIEKERIIDALKKV